MLRRNLRLKTIAIVSLAGLLILAGVAVGAVRLIDRAAPEYRAELADWVGDKLGQPLTIGRLGLSWTWRGPSLRLSDVALLDADGETTGLHLEALALRFAFTDLVRGQTMPQGIVLVAPQLTVAQTADGRFRLRGLADSGGPGFSLDEGGKRLQRIERLRVRDGRLRITADALKTPVELDEVTLLLTNHGSRHRLDAEATIASGHGERIAAQATVTGDLGRLAEADSHLRVRTQGLDGPLLLALAGGETGDLRGGHAELETRVEWTAGRFTGARADAHLKAVHRANPDNDAAPLAPALRTSISISPTDEGIRAQLDSLTSEALVTGEADGTLTLNTHTGRVHGELTNWPASLAAAGLRLWRPGMLTKADAEGRLPRATFDRRPNEGWHLLAEFADLRINEAGRGLDIGPLGGRLTLGTQGGTLRVDTRNAGVEWARYIHGRLPLDAASGEIAWRPDTNGRTIHLTDLRVVSAGTAISGGGNLRLPANGPPKTDMSFRVVSPDIAPVLDYLPRADDMPNRRLRDWLPDAIRAGRIENGYVRLNGPLDRFPFANGGGTFRVEMEGEDVTLAYKPGWPVLKDIRGKLQLAGDTLDIRAQSGRMLGVNLDPAHAHIPNVREPILTVDGGVTEADAAAMLGFLPQSPLADKFGQLATVLEVSGQAGLQLDLEVPLKPNLGELGIDGRIRLAGVRLDHDVLPKPIQSIRGTVRFDRKGLYADGLEAAFLGMPVTASLTPASGDALAIDARTRMRLPEDAGALGTLLPAAMLERGRGESIWRTSLTVAPTGRVSDLRLTSDLSGLALDLPPPLRKPAAPTAPVTLTLASDRSRAQVIYDDRLALDVQLTNGQPQAMNLVFGGAEITPPSGPGLWVGGTLPVVDIGAWRKLAADLDTDDGPDMPLRGADVDTAGLRLRGQRIGPVSVAVLPLVAADGWLARIDGEGAAGNMRWLSSGDRPQVNANFEHIALQLADTDGDKPDDGNEATSPGSAERIIDPATLPTVDLSVDRLRVEGSDLGRLQFDADALPEGLELKTLHLGGNGVTLTADGRWQRRDGASQAAINGHLSGDSIGRVLQALGYSATLKANNADIEVDLRFANHPDGLELSTLGGTLHFRFRDGTLAAVKPGAGRVLGLLNFYALPRRLLLNFRDVVGEGLAFDTLSGDFRIDSGNAYTDNLYIETPAATIHIAGRMGIAARDYDQQVTIEPKVSSAATIAGTVLGGPAVGAALFVAQRLLNQPIADITSVTYHLTGQWSDPEIEPLDTEKIGD